jgi:hypothetical protein
MAMATKPPTRKKRRYGPARAGDVARALIRAPLAKRGFAQSQLLTEWDAIVGVQIADLVRPLRLGHAARAGVGGTLTLGVLGARALEAQHMEPAIIERVNAHYGYRAVSRIRLLQVGAEIFAVKTTQTPDLAPTPAQENAVKTAVAQVSDENLRDALERLGRNIAIRGDINRREK